MNGVEQLVALGFGALCGQNGGGGKTDYRGNFIDLPRFKDRCKGEDLDGAD